VSGGQLQVGDRVQTPDGPGTVWRTWTETSWAFGVPKTVARLSVKLDPEAKGWIRIYAPGDLEPEEFSSRGENQAEALAVERDQERRHGEPS
jgi:hypothetical protein